MKNLRNAATTLTVSLLTILIVLCATSMPQLAVASGGNGAAGGGGVANRADTIKINKCYYFDTGSYVELLLNAVSSDSNAHLHAYLPDGTYLGEVQNGGGGRYGGTVFVTLTIPADIIFVSSSGGRIIAPTTLFQF